MLALKHFRDKAKGVADLLNYAALIDEGVVLCKDGALLGGFFFRGPDTASATAEARNYLTARVNAALARLGSGYALWVEAVRLPSASYPEPSRSFFPDPVTRAIDEERRRQFLAEGAHFESEHALLLMYTPPLRRTSRIAELVYDDGDASAAPKATGDVQIAQFKRALSDLEDGLGDVLNLRRMASFTVPRKNGRPFLQDELINFLQFCVTGVLSPIAIPPCAMYLDALLGGEELYVGDTPRIGDLTLSVLAIEGFPHESFPGLLDRLDGLSIAYRFSTRFIALDSHEALSELRAYRRKWRQWMRGFWSQVFKTSGGMVNEDASLMARQTEDAITDAQSGLLSFGYYTPVIVVMGKSREEVLENARAIQRELRRDGFAARIETVNALEAWLGSLPGHVHPNIRRPLLHSLNLADLLPLSAAWPGLPENPSPLFPPGSPPLLHGATSGSTPFRLNLHVSDVGHTLIFGPTGAGKSTALAILAAQFRRYPNAKITLFDKGRSLFALAMAAGGRHYDLGGGANGDAASVSPALCPLALLEDERDAAFAEEWIASLFELQAGKPPIPRQRQEIHRAIALMRESRLSHSLTDFVMTVQDQDIQAALSPYTLDGAHGQLLDARSDGLQDSAFTVFEIEDLMARGEKIVIPVLLYLFRYFERGLTGAPALLILDEAWIMLSHPTFRDKIRDWLKTLRKANCAVVLATQSLSDAARSGLLDVLLEACPTKILLPNEEADKGGTDAVMGPRDLYALFGLNEAEIELIKTGIKKRHYYTTSPQGRRLFELKLGPLALAFAGVSSREDIARIRALIAERGEAWPEAWLHARGVDPALLNEANHAA
jgi:type IV secretion system protein VirB4